MPYLTPAETAVILRRSVKSLYRLIDADDTFPHVKLPGGGLLIPRAGLERWLADRTQGTRTPVRLAVTAPTSTSSSTHDAAGALNGGGK